MISTSPSQRIQKSPLGVVGGGQLAQMLVKAAKKRAIKIVVQTGSESDPAALESNKVVVASSTDISGTKKLITDCKCVTFENEWVNISGLKKIDRENNLFVPSLSALEPLIDKISQRQLLNQLNISGPDWLRLDSKEIDSLKLPYGWNFPLMAKSGRGGYDGKGTKIIKDINALSDLIKNVNPRDWFLEKWVDYDQELAIVASRDRTGIVRTFPLVETSQAQNVCDWVLAPASVGQDVEALTYNIALSILNKLNYIGVIAIEFFYGKEGLMVNEIAPRTHNSAHFSIEACNSSQFDQQLCIAADLPIPDPKMIVPGALMVNLLGLSNTDTLPIQNRLEKLRQHESLNLHWYGKTSEIPGRKLGHVTVLLNSQDSQARKVEAFKALELVRSIWPMYSVN